LTSKNCRAKITIRAGNKAKSVYSALAPDIGRLRGKGERLDMSLHGTLVVFSIETGDLASLRANVNSYLRLADASLKCIESATL
jgi:tRNA threonylcarbamoyladenosine modification (KEOPS) complex  Pcc1 subunit